MKWKTKKGTLNIKGEYAYFVDKGSIATYFKKVTLKEFEKNI